MKLEPNDIEIDALKLAADVKFICLYILIPVGERYFGPKDK